MSRLQVFSVLFAGLLVGVFAEDVKFPELNQIFSGYFQSEVEITDLNEQVSAFVTEYYDDIEKQGRIDIMAFGSKQSIYYYNATNEILEVNRTHCVTWRTDLSDFYYYELFYGWLRKKDPLIIGPSALFFYANEFKDKVVYEEQAEVRGIKCDKFRFYVENDKDDFNVTYYFTIDGWTTPYQYENLRVPVRIELDGISSRETSKADSFAPVNQVVDFFSFKSVVSSLLDFHPPIGLGCPFRKPTLDLPKISQAFKLSAESYDLLIAGNKSDTDVNFAQMWYDGRNKIARLDRWNRLEYQSSLYDFNTGVTYVQENGQTCRLEPLMDSYFEGHNFPDLVGYFKEAEEVLGLNGDFYYMGEREIRGIKADVFESAKKDVLFNGDTLDKMVIIVYFTQEFMEVSVESEREERVPIFIQVIGYQTPKTIILNRQYNIFGFDDNIYPAMYTTFKLDRCFPAADQKSYFLLIIKANRELAAQMENQNDIFIPELGQQIMFASNISVLRLPFLKADYKMDAVYVTGLMLDRPPALKQFWTMGFDMITHSHESPIPVFDAATEEACAEACINKKEFDCTGFYFCNKDCFLMKSPTDDSKEDHWEMPKCTSYYRAEKESAIKDSSLTEALKNLEQAVIKQTLKVSLNVVVGGKNATITMPVQDILIGEGPFTGGDKNDLSYELIISGSQLKSNVETTQQIDSADTAYDCYKGCKGSDSLVCSSFSYCAKADNKRCRISSVFLTKTDKKSTDIEADPNCIVYSLKYLDFYEPLPGRMIMALGDKPMTGVSSTEECAKNCRLEKDFTCRGFEFCKKKKNCVLHSKHVLDLKKDDMIDTDQIECVHYSAKFIADFKDMGHNLINDDSNKRTALSLEECARACSEEFKECKSFNYCPASEPESLDSECTLTTKTTIDNGAKNFTKGKCHLYTKKAAVEDWNDSKKPPPNTKVIYNTEGYTSKGFTGLVIGMIAFGLIIGILGFVGYSYFRSRSTDEGLTVRFMKQADT